MCNKTGNSDDSVGWLRSLTKKKEKPVCLVVHTFLGLPEGACEQLRHHLHCKHTIADLYTCGTTYGVTILLDLQLMENIPSQSLHVTYLQIEHETTLGLHFRHVSAVLTIWTPLVSA